MPSRFDLITRKIPDQEKNTDQDKEIQIISEEEEETLEESEEDSETSTMASPLQRNHRRPPDFLRHLKLVNENSGHELYLTGADFNLSVAANYSGTETTINISFTCPLEQARGLVEGLQ
jgi:hypothetical protein